MVVNNGKYTIHGCYGYYHIPWCINFRITLTPQPIFPRFSRCIPWPFPTKKHTPWDSGKRRFFSAEIGTISASSRLSKSCLLFKSQELKVRLVMMQPEPVEEFLLNFSFQNKQKKHFKTYPKRFRGKFGKIIRLKSTGWVAGWYYVFSFPWRDSNV